MQRSFLNRSWVIKILVFNAIIYLIQLNSASLGSIVQQYGSFSRPYNYIDYYFALTPALTIGRHFFWQVFTYMFLHNPNGFAHILLNSYALFIFGMPLEQMWGSKKFLVYYLFTGIGAGITVLLINTLLYLKMGNLAAFITPTLGASGAVFGILLAFGMLFPNAQILLFFVIPMRAKYFVFLYGAVEFYLLISTGGGGTISHVGHVGGLLFGLIFFLITRRRFLKFKGKQFAAQVQKDRERKPVGPRDDTAFLKESLSIIKTQGTDAIDDDTFQRLKLLLIFHNNNKALCVEEDFNPDDNDCIQCENLAPCYAREIEKYLK